MARVHQYFTLLGKGLYKTQDEGPPKLVSEQQFLPSEEEPLEDDQSSDKTPLDT
jgi:hypothetical protein